MERSQKTDCQLYQSFFLFLSLFFFLASVPCFHSPDMKASKHVIKTTKPYFPQSLHLMTFNTSLLPYSRREKRFLKEPESFVMQILSPLGSLGGITCVFCTVPRRRLMVHLWRGKNSLAIFYGWSVGVCVNMSKIGRDEVDR